MRTYILPALGRQRQENCEFEDSLAYRETCGLVLATKQDHMSDKNKQTNSRKEEEREGGE